MTDERRGRDEREREETVGTPADRALAETIRTRASRPAAPAALRARVEAALAAEVASLRLRSEAAAAAGVGPAARARPPWPALAAGLAGVLLAAATAETWRGLPEAGRRLAAETVRETRAEYERLEAQGPVSPVAGPADLSRLVTDALGVPVRIGEPSGGGVRPQGTARATLFGREGVAVFFDAGGETLMLTLVPSPTGLPPENRVRLGRGRPFVAASGGTRFVLWRQGPLFCALAGDLPEPRLTALFRKLRPGIEVGG